MTIGRPLRAAAVCGIALMASHAAPARGQPQGGKPSPNMSLEASAAMRFPQEVRAGDLVGRDVLQPVESQTVLGHVRALVRDRNDQVMVVVAYGGFLGIGGRLIAIPIDAMVLLGQDMEVVAYTPEQLRRLPTFTASEAPSVPEDTGLKIGLAKPSH